MITVSLVVIRLKRDLATESMEEDLVLFRVPGLNGIRRRLFRSQKALRPRNEHMYLIDDIDLTLAFLGRNAPAHHDRISSTELLLAA